MERARVAAALLDARVLCHKAFLFAFCSVAFLALMDFAKGHGGRFLLRKGRDAPGKLTSYSSA
jgi:hypothetical protein